MYYHFHSKCHGLALEGLLFVFNLFQLLGNGQVGGNSMYVCAFFFFEGAGLKEFIRLDCVCVRVCVPEGESEREREREKVRESFTIQTLVCFSYDSARQNTQNNPIETILYICVCVVGGDEVYVGLSMEVRTGEE